MKMFDKINEKIKMYWIKKASYYSEKGDYKNILKSLDCLERSLRFASKEERNYVSSMLIVSVIEASLKEQV